MSNITTINLGCRLNFYETQQMEHQARAKGESNLTLINSCAVTNQAVRQSKQAVRAAKRRNPHHKIIMTGCAAQPMPEVDEVVENKNKLHFFRTNEQAAFSPQTRHRSLLKIQDGCDWQCTFCYTTIARGQARSRTPEELTQEALFLSHNGHLEITLTGVDIASYGKELTDAPRLGDLLEKLLAATPATLKFRLSSLDPAAVDEKLFALLAHEPRIKPFLHLSIQSGDDLILKRMKRRHTRAQVIALCETLRAHRSFTFGGDIIAGFPTESEAMFENSKAMLSECDIVFAHIFPFSARTNTKAALMPSLDAAVIKQRAATLRALATQRRDDFLQSQVGTTQVFLAESETRGRSDSNCQATWQPSLASGVYHTMKVLASEGGALRTQPIALQQSPF